MKQKGALLHPKSEEGIGVYVYARNGYLYTLPPCRLCFAYDLPTSLYWPQTACTSVLQIGRWLKGKAVAILPAPTGQLADRWEG